MPYEEVSHTADVALRVWGRTLEELFVSAAEGMFWLAGARAESSASRTATLEIESPDLETLLVTWLNELLWLVEGEGWRPTGYDFSRLERTHVVASVCGGALAALGKHIKAVTFNEVDVRCSGDVYATALVFDV